MKVDKAVKVCKPGTTPSFVHRLVDRIQTVSGIILLKATCRYAGGTDAAV